MANKKKAKKRLLTPIEKEWKRHDGIIARCERDITNIMGRAAAEIAVLEKKKVNHHQIRDALRR